MSYQAKLFKRFFFQSAAAIKKREETNAIFCHAEDVAGIGSWQWNLATNKLTYSDNQFRLFGFEPGSFDPTFERFFEFVHPDDRTALKADHQKNMESVEFHPLYFRIIRKDGATRHMKGMAKRTKNEKGETLLFGTTQDITAETLLKHQLQERTGFAEAVLENSTNMVIALNGDKIYTLWNKAGEELTGITKEQILGKRMSDFLPYEDHRNKYDLVERGLKGERIQRVELPYNNGNRTGEFSYIPIKDEEGQVINLVVVCTDVTDRKRSANDLKQLNQVLEEKNKELEQSNKELSSFNFIASHDLQEPLRKIQTFCSVLMNEETLSNEKSKTYLSRMQLAATRMRALINDLLTFSQTSIQQKEVTTINLNNVLQEVKSSLKTSIEEKEAMISASKLPAILGVNVQLYQLFQNLIGNAIKYSQPNCAPMISITSEMVAGTVCEHLLPNQTYWLIKFKDNGIGFEQEYASTIFELFQRLHAKTEYPGTGIGLAICKKIVQNHGGHIRAFSRPFEGATFEVFLPVAKVLQPSLELGQCSS